MDNSVLEGSRLRGGEDGFDFALGEGVVVGFVFGGFDEELEPGAPLEFRVEDDAGADDGGGGWRRGRRDLVFLFFFSFNFI